MTGQTQGWGGGYVTDIEYMPGWYPHQSPVHLAVSCLLNGFACDLPAEDEDVHYMELGCGLGFGAMVVAASNPHWRVTAIDFNPAHIAQARAIARDAGLRNIAFLEADLATLAEEEEGRRLPRADFVTMHGVWSWVGPEVRAGIVRLLRDKVTAGGVVHLSYNALPGWQSGLGMQRLLLRAGDRAGGSSHERAAAGTAMLRALMDAEAVHLTGSLVPRRLVDRLDSLPVAYVAHEFMNRTWAPAFHADVVEALAGAKLDWIGSASLAENYAALMLTEPQREIYNQTSDPLLRELIKDMCLPRSLRHDVFVRGAQRLPAAVRDSALRDLTLALQVPLADASMEVDLGSRSATLSEAFHRPILEALSSGPMTVGEVLARVAPGQSPDPREVVGILVGIGYALPLLRPGQPPDPIGRRFNRVAARWLVNGDNFNKPFALASGATGGGFGATAFDLFINDRVQAGEGTDQVDDWLAMLGATGDPETRDALRTALLSAAGERLRLARMAGVEPPF